MKPWMSPRDVADYLAIGYSGAEKIMLTMPHEGRGPRLCVTFEALQAWIDAHTVVAKGEPPRPRSSVIYFVAAADLIKIGVTGDLEKRLAGFKTSSPVSVTLLATIPGDFKAEQELHKKFAHLRSHGEWFRRGDDLVAFVEGLAK